MTGLIVPSGEPVRNEITDELDRIRERRLSQTPRKFDDVQREVDDTVLNLKGTNDSEFRLKLLRKLRHLIEEAARVLTSKQ